MAIKAKRIIALLALLPLVALNQLVAMIALFALYAFNSLEWPQTQAVNSVKLTYSL